MDCKGRARFPAMASNAASSADLCAEKGVGREEVGGHLREGRGGRREEEGGGGLREGRDTSLFLAKKTKGVNWRYPWYRPGPYC